MDDTRCTKEIIELTCGFIIPLASIIFLVLPVIPSMRYWNTSQNIKFICSMAILMLVPMLLYIGKQIYNKTKHRETLFLEVLYII